MNTKQYELLTKSVDEWNNWREENPDVQIDLAHANLTDANLACANLACAKLNGANLNGANLNNANLTGADIDFASWPLWCGSLSAIIDEHIAAQLAYHLVSVCQHSGIDCTDVMALAKKFHRAEACNTVKFD
jgi:hypothetical protein